MASLQLHTVSPGQGLLWVSNAFRLFFRRPLAFSGLFALYLLAILVAMTLPYLGPLLVLVSIPLLSLGFMLASRAALEDRPVHPGFFVEPLKGDARRRRTLLNLCGVYALASVLALMASDWIDGGRFEQLQRLMASGEAQREEIDALFEGGRLQWGMVVRFGLIALLSVPFWHAAALVHWGGQGTAQSLFSSTLAVWRTRGAFIMYFVGWIGVTMLFITLAALVLGMLGMTGAMGIAIVPAGLMFSTVFYTSLYFVFTDTFGRPSSEGDTTGHGDLDSLN